MSKLTEMVIKKAKPEAKAYKMADGELQHCHLDVWLSAQQKENLVA